MPFTRAAERILEIAGRGDNFVIDVVRDPVGFVVVVEFDPTDCGHGERDVGAIRGSTGPVIFVPTIVERDFIGPETTWHIKVGLPEIIVRIVDKFAERALGLPIIRTAKFGLEIADDGNAYGVGDLRGVEGLGR